MARAHVINITEDGTIETLWTDEIPLAALGTMTINRASEIEFNNACAVWEVKIHGRIMFSDPSRARCIQWEHRHFNRELMKR